jgi:hypothetical protein
MNKLQFDLQPVRHKAQEIPAHESKQNRDYVRSILQAYGWLPPTATPEPEFSEPSASAEPKVQRIKVKVKK